MNDQSKDARIMQCLTVPSGVNEVWKRARSVLIALPLVLGGCAGYHMGSLMHPQVHAVAVGSFRNTLDEPRLGARFRDMLIAALMTDGSLRVTNSPEQADAVIEGKILSYKYGAAARSKVRSEKDRASDRDAYQTTIYRAKVIVSYDIRVPGRSQPLREDQRVAGIAEFPGMPDMRQAHLTGLEAALRDAAVKTAASITEAW